MDPDRVAKRMFDFGGLFVAGLFIAADAAHWFLTPARATASDGRTLAVDLQIVLGLALAATGWIRARRLRRQLGAAP